MDRPFSNLSDLAQALAQAMNLISTEVQNHHQKVAYLAWNIAGEMNLSERERLMVLGGALMHDVGSVTMQGQLSLRDLEKDALALARAGASILKSHPLTRDFTDVVKNSQTPWRRLGALSLLRPVLLGQIVHLADRVSLMLDETRPVLNQVARIRACIAETGDREYHPEVLAAFERVSRREAVWLDMLYMPGRFLDYLPDSRRVSLDETLQYTELVSHLIDFRSPFTAMHSAGVAATAEALSGLAGMSESECSMMRIAGHLHDIGKLKIPREILEKPGKLTDEEFNIMKEHAYFSYEILRQIRGFEQIAAWAAFHHEKLNGEGYPFHLTAREIPLGARIMAVADVFSAITEDRPYRRGMDREQALAVLRGDVARGGLSRDVVELLIQNYGAINAARDTAAHIAGRRYYEAMEKSDGDALQTD